jgi:hypothetical protein
VLCGKADKSQSEITNIQNSKLIKLVHYLAIARSIIMLGQALFFIFLFICPITLYALPANFLCLDENEQIVVRCWYKENKYIMNAILDNTYYFLEMQKKLVIIIFF